MEITRQENGIGKVLRREPQNLSILPYMRSTTSELKNKVYCGWNNQGGWGDCWHNGGWFDSWHQDWHNSSINSKGLRKAPMVFSEVILIREVDGYLMNKANGVIFHADAESSKFLASLKDVPMLEVAANYPKTMELLWLN